MRGFWVRFVAAAEDAPGLVESLRLEEDPAAADEDGYGREPCNGRDVVAALDLGGSRPETSGFFLLSAVPGSFGLSFELKNSKV